MDYPEYSFPTNVCQHFGENGWRQRRFAEYGSHSQVNSYPDREGHRVTLKCHLQKGFGVIKGLGEILPPLPLNDRPIRESSVIQDDILGMDDYGNVMASINELLQRIQSCRMTINQSRPWLVKINEECERLCDACLDDPYNAERWEELCNKLPVWAFKLVKDYSRLSSALNDRCLQGYNQNFYQGLLCHKQSSSSTFLFHAGYKFKDIYMTEVLRNDSELPRGREASVVNLKKPVFQLSCSEKGLLCARQRKRCRLFTFDDTDCSLRDTGQSASLEHNVLCDVSPSPYIQEEIVLSSDLGDVCIWNINNSSSHTSFRKKMKSNYTDSCIRCHFAGHPRQIVVSDYCSVELFDHRNNFSKGTEIFSLSPSVVKSQESIKASCTLGFPYHLVATDHSLFVLDQRFPASPVMQWSSEGICPPQILKTCQFSAGSLGTDKDQWIFTGTQHPAEVTCYPLSLAKGCAPVTKTLPWRAGKLGDFCLHRNTSYQLKHPETETLFHSSLAGMTVVNNSAQDQKMFSVYQMDGYGDIYFQDFELDSSQSDNGTYSLQTPTSPARYAADQRTSQFVSVLDDSMFNDRKCTAQIIMAEDGNVAYSTVKNFLEGVTKENLSKEDDTDRRMSYNQFEFKVCSTRGEKMKRMDILLKAKGPNTKLLWALKDGNDIHEALEEREKDHLKKKMALHEKYLKSQEKRKSHKSSSTPKPNKVLCTPKIHKEFLTPQTYEDFRTPNTHKDISTATTHKNFRTPKTREDFHTPKTNEGFYTPKDSGDFRTPKTHEDISTPTTEMDSHTPKPQKDFHTPKTNKGSYTPKDPKDFCTPKKKPRKRSCGFSRLTPKYVFDDTDMSD